LYRAGAFRAFREHSGKIQGTFGEHSENTEGEHPGSIQGIFIRGTSIQGAFREYSENI
jgi:hypothetical protein